MPIVLPTVEQIEDYLESVEELIVSSLSAATPDLPKVSEAIHRLWQDVLRHSPQAVPASLKGLGAFEVPPPPPPPPPPRTFWENSAEWVADHPWTTAAGIGVGVVGAGLLVGYAHPRIKHRARVGVRKHAPAASTERRQVIGECSPRISDPIVAMIVWSGGSQSGPHTYMPLKLYACSLSWWPRAKTVHLGHGLRTQCEALTSLMIRLFV